MGKNSTIADGKSSKSGDTLICTCPENRDVSVGEISNTFSVITVITVLTNTASISLYSH